jgi:DNA-binding CsgD family transcriptional regulator
MADFAQAVDGVYRAHDERDGWSAALSLVARHCEARSALLMVHERCTGRIGFALQHGLSDRDRQRMADFYRLPVSGPVRQLDLRLQDLLDQPVGSVRTDTMLADYGAYLASPAYREVYSRFGTEHAMGGFVCERGGRAVAVRLFRSRREGAFRLREIRRYERLIPHLGRSIDLAQLRSRATLLAAAVGDGSIAPGESFCVIDEDGSLMASGGEAQELLAIDGGAGRTLLSRVRQGDAFARVGLADGRELVASRSEERRPRTVAGLCGPVFVLVARGRQEAGWRARRAAESHGLTRAETRLLEALCGSERPTLTEAAQRLAIGRETAKTQLRSIFQKTGVNRQADLLRRVAGDPG